MMAWLRTNQFAAWILTVFRVYLGYQFLTVGWEKLTAPKPFSAAAFLSNAVKHPVLGTNKLPEYPTFTAFLQNFALPHVGVLIF